MNPSLKQVILKPRNARREVRQAVQGVANIRSREGQPGPWAEATLADFSESGFRLIHLNSTLTAGQELDFVHPYAKGTARVVWNRILDGRVETGCMILTRQ